MEVTTTILISHNFLGEGVVKIEGGGGVKIENLLQMVLFFLKKKIKCLVLN